MKVIGLSTAPLSLSLMDIELLNFVTPALNVLEGCCPECGFLCCHMYKCDEQCYDYGNGHICKHIHCVHQSFIFPADDDDKAYAGSKSSKDKYDIKKPPICTPCTC